jgi:tetratricopeptide (TPR) repeat protein
MKGTSALIVILCFSILISGCAARSTSDPAVKLSWAAEEFGRNEDPLAAEELLQEALQTYRKQMDRLGLAETYRHYGLFLRSHAVTKFREHYLRAGFLDETVRFNTRYDKALEYLKKSRDIFAEKELPGPLSNVYLSMAKTYALMNRVPESCENLAKGRASYSSIKKSASDVREVGVDEASNIDAYIALMEKQMGCREGPATVVSMDDRRP